MPQNAMPQLRDLAYARSGDKGDVSNIGLIAQSPEAYEILREYLTPDRIKGHFGPMVKGDVEVYEMPNIHVLQIVMRRALEGGATRNLRFDQTGKAMGTALLRLPVPVEFELLPDGRRVPVRAFAVAGWGA
jgi:hypothetical protein